MTDTDTIVEQIRRLIGRDCRFHGRACRIVEVLTTELRVVLEARDETPPIQADQYGRAMYRANEHIEIPLIGQDGEPSAALKHLLDGM
jgi:hypothetical protein